MTNEEDKSNKEENKKRMLLALALIAGADVEFSRTTSDADLWDQLPSGTQEKAIDLYDKYNLQKKIEIDERVPEKEIFVDSAKVAYEEGETDYWELKGTLDDRTCANCRKWIGQIITMSGNDPRYKTYDQFMADHVFHPNCRCSLHKAYQVSPGRKGLSEEAYKLRIKKQDLNKMAANTEPIKDQILYTGFIDEQMENETGLGTYDYGETLVMLAPYGIFQGYSNGNSVNETINDYAVDTMVAEYKTNPTERLLDIDHKSMRVPEERDTTAAGWIYDLVAVKDLGRMSGLYGKIKWTDVGRGLVESRQYRFLSPVFQLDEEGHPIKLINAALTNRPAMTSINPILNTTPDTTQIDLTKEDIDMTKEEMIDLIKATVAQIEAEKEMAEETVETCECTECSKEEAVNSEEEKAETTEETKEEETVEKVEEEKTEEKVEEEKEGEEEDVIKEEVLNTSPTLGIDVSANSAWKNLHGAEFFKYISAHKNEIM